MRISFHGLQPNSPMGCHLTDIFSYNIFFIGYCFFSAHKTVEHILCTSIIMKTVGYNTS